MPASRVATKAGVRKARKPAPARRGARPGKAKPARRARPSRTAGPAARSLAEAGIANEVAQRGLKGALLHTMEGRLFLAGLVGLALLVSELVVLAVLAPSWGQALLSMVSVELFAGREGAIPLGVAGGTPAWLVAQVSATQDLVAVALVYPLFLYAIERFHDRDNFVMRRIRRIDEAAAKRRELVDRWGAFGLVAFMLVPFLVNGPLVGAIAGRLAGMRAKAIIAPVIIATVVSAVAWSYFYKGMQSLFPDLDPRWSILVTVVVIGVALSVSVLLDRRGKAKAAKGDPNA